MAYVYRHIRLDKNEPFYIGIGDKRDGFASWGYEFYRAFTDKKRNNLWHKIASKTGFIVEILIDGISWDEACKKEVEFISLYGRINNDTGRLANLTDGGSGAAGIKLSKEVIEADIERKSIKVAQYDLSGKFLQYFQSIKAAANLFGKNINLSPLHDINPKYVKGYLWKRYTGDNSDIVVVDKTERIASYDKHGDYLKTYNSRSEAAKDLGIKEHTVWCFITGRLCSTINSIRLRVDNGDHSNIGFYEYTHNGYKQKGKFLGSKNKRSKSVYQIDRGTNEIIGSYGSCRDAANAVGLKSRTQISASCCGKIPSAGGFLWKYKEPN